MRFLVLFIIMVMVKLSNRREELKKKKLMIVLSILSLVIFIVVVGLGWYVFDYSSKKNKINESNSLQNSMGEKGVLSNDKVKADVSVEAAITPNDLSAEAVAGMVSKHMLLTEGEVTVATIINVEGLKIDYPELFQYAKNGDKLLFYQLGIIIYDPVLDKIVDVMRRLPEGVYIPNNVFDENLF